MRPPPVSDGILWILSAGPRPTCLITLRIAAEMSRLTGDPFDAQHLDIQKLKFIKNERALQWEVTSKLVEVEEEDEDKEDDMEKKEDAEDKKKEKKMVPKVWHFEYDLKHAATHLGRRFQKRKERSRLGLLLAPDSSYVLFFPGPQPLLDGLGELPESPER